MFSISFNSPEIFFPMILATVILLAISYAAANIILEKRKIIARLDEKGVRKEEREKVFKRLRSWQKNDRRLKKKETRAKRENRRKGLGSS